MLKSMTAFGRAREIVSGKDITAEIRSVNGRFFDCSVKITRSYSFLEEKIKSYLQQRGISRGKIEVYVGIDTIEQEGILISLDKEYASSYINALRQLRDEFGLNDDISVSRVAANRDIFTIIKPEDDLEKDWECVKTVLEKALCAFFSEREREGDNLERDITMKIENIKKLASEVSRLSSDDLSNYFPKLEARIRQLLERLFLERQLIEDNSVEINEQRILTEVAIFCDRAAIDEELVRLSSHFDAFKTIMESPEPAGRKLDFLLQEINRETNTIGSKAGNAEIAHIVVDIKSELEKIREQIQNIE